MVLYVSISALAAALSLLARGDHILGILSR